MLVCIGSTLSDVDSLSYCPFRDTDSTVCIYLCNLIGSLRRTVQCPTMDILGCKKNLIAYCIIMVYSEPVFSCSGGVYLLLFPDPDCFPISKKFKQRTQLDITYAVNKLANFHTIQELSILEL